MKVQVSKIIAAYEIISKATAAHSSWPIVECAMWMRGITRSFSEFAESVRKKHEPGNIEELLNQDGELTDEQKNILADYYKTTTDIIVEEGSKEVEVIIPIDDDVIRDFISANGFTVEQSIDLYEFLKNLGN